MNRVYYTPHEFAKMFKVDYLTVRRWLLEGKVKGFKIGRMWRIAEEEIENFERRSKERTNKLLRP